MPLQELSREEIQTGPNEFEAVKVLREIKILEIQKKLNWNLLENRL